MQSESFNRRMNASAMLMLAVSGCTAEASRYIHFPDFAHPGPEGVQRAQAIQHDPYLLNDVGPEVVGGRPLSYQQSLTEQERAKLRAGPVAVVSPIPAPGSSVLAPPVPSSPFATPPPQPGMPLQSATPPIVTSLTAPTAVGGIPYYPPPSAPIMTGAGSVPPAVYTGPPALAPQSTSFPAQQRAPY
jgi:hypothetical protein